jgi:uncharacterized protein
MRIAVISDSHSRYDVVEKVLRLLRERDITVVIHCGDICNAATVSLFQGLTTHFVFGNCDRVEQTSIGEAVRTIGGTLHGAWGQLELEGVKIAFLHGDDQRLMRDVERSEHFDFLFYGHTHVAAEHRTGPTRVINPGALHRARPKRFVILDLASREVETVVAAE